VKVLLLEDVETLGPAGAVLSVADGYARNYLVPRRLARLVTEGSANEVEQVRKAAARKTDRERTVAQDLARRIEGLTLTFRSRAGETGKLYGSVTPADLATALEENLGQPFDRRKIMADPLRQLGDHEVQVHLFSEVVARLKVTIVPEDLGTPAQE
jgi:large subunit ribosomal protein L9